MHKYIQNVTQSRGQKLYISGVCFIGGHREEWGKYNVYWPIFFFILFFFLFFFFFFSFFLFFFFFYFFLEGGGGVFTFLIIIIFYFFHIFSQTSTIKATYSGLETLNK